MSFQFNLRNAIENERIISEMHNSNLSEKCVTKRCFYFYIRLTLTQSIIIYLLGITSANNDGFMKNSKKLKLNFNKIH